MSISQRLAEVSQRISQACEKVGRDPSEVRLLPVSKTRPIADLQAAMDAGYFWFGENKVQEMVAKAEELGPDSPAKFVVIGHLQRNKAKVVAALAAEFQALDSLRLAGALNRHLAAMGRELDVYLQINSSGEETKGGFAPKEVVAVAKQLGDYPNLRIKGLMTLAHPDLSQAEGCFRLMQDLQTQLQAEASSISDWKELSMGMSGDFELAIAHGATCVRVGTAIFGERQY